MSTSVKSPLDAHECPPGFTEFTVKGWRRTYTLARYKSQAFNLPLTFFVKVNGHAIASADTWSQAVFAFQALLGRDRSGCLK